MYLPRGSPDLVDVLCLRGRPITGLGLAPGGGVRAKWWWCATKERWCAASGYLDLTLDCNEVRARVSMASSLHESTVQPGARFSERASRFCFSFTRPHSDPSSAAPNHLTHPSPLMPQENCTPAKAFPPSCPLAQSLG